MTHRKGYTLMEILAVIAAIMLLMALSVKPLRLLVADIPRANRDVQTWMQTQDMLRQLKSDIEQSTRIQLTAMDPRVSGPLLYLQQANGLVSYSLADGGVLREAGDGSDRWDLPHVHVDWRLWESKGIPYALEISTWSERTILNKHQKKFEQSSVYFQKTGSTHHENP